MSVLGMLKSFPQFGNSCTKLHVCFTTMPSMVSSEEAVLLSRVMVWVYIIPSVLVLFKPGLGFSSDKIIAMFGIKVPWNFFYGSNV